jgi:butyryl-CoA dehydrogenase
MPDVFMTKEELAFRDEFRNFVQREIEPLGLPKKMENEEIDFPLDLVRALGRAGYFGMCLPEAYGGRSRGLVYETIKSEELGYSGPALSCPGCLSGWVANAVAQYGTEAQKESYASPIARGEKVAAIAMTEPGAGSDINGYKTRAVPDGDNYIITGEKRFQVGGLGADFFLTFAVTDPDVPPLKGGLSAFLIDREMGVEVVEKFRMMGYHGAGVSHLLLKGARVPRNNLLGRPGEGLKILNAILVWERLSTSAGMLGAARRCLDETVKYTLEREAYGTTLSRMPAVNQIIADLIIKRDVAATMILRGCRLVDRHGARAMKEVAEAKYIGTEYSFDIIDKGIQIFGGIGYTDKYPLESFYRIVRLGRIASGTSEVMKYIVQRDAYQEVLGRQEGVGAQIRFSP